MITDLFATAGIVCMFLAAIDVFPLHPDEPRAPVWAPFFLYLGLSLFFFGWAVLPMWGVH